MAVEKKKVTKSKPPVEKTQTFQTLEDALNFVDALARQKPKATGYLSVGSWSVRWKG